MRRVLAAVAAMASMAQTASAAPVELPDLIPPQIDPDNTVSCTELVPKALSLDPTPTTLSVRVLLDGAVADDHARAAAETMRRAYTPLDIPLEFSFERVSFAGTDAAEINEQAKILYGGQRPAGVDIVYTMTDKNLTADGSPAGDNVAGLADCIGGVRFADRAFATGEVITDIPDGTAKTMAHEVGHLVGGHHHYSSPEGLLAESPALLTLMGPALDLITLRFSTLNGVVARGHAQLYAAP